MDEGREEEVEQEGGDGWEGAERDEEKHSRAWLKAALAIFVLLIVGVASYYGSDALRSTYDIPPRYKTEIESLRDKNIANSKKVQELSKQIAEINADTAFNASRMDTIAQEAVNSLSLNGGEYRINITTLKIERVPK